MATLARWARQPLLHFVVLGAGLVGIERWQRPLPPTVIVVDREVRAGLVQDFSRRFGRAPSPVEAQALVQRYIETEVLVREASRRHLGDGDVIVRRRLLQKMELLLDALGEQGPPSEAMLADYLATHAARYQRPPMLTLEQVFVSGRSAEKKAQAEALRQRVQAGEGAVHLGEPFLHGRRLGPLALPELSRLFGGDVGEQAQQQAPMQWSAPVVSAYGWHVLRVIERTPGRPATLAEVHAEVLRDLGEETHAQRRKQALDKLRQRYQIQAPDGAW